MLFLFILLSSLNGSFFSELVTIFTIVIVHSCRTTTIVDLQIVHDACMCIWGKSGDEVLYLLYNIGSFAYTQDERAVWGESNYEVEETQVCIHGLAIKIHLCSMTSLYVTNTHAAKSLQQVELLCTRRDLLGPSLDDL